MRAPVVVLVATSALLLIAFTGFSDIAAVPIALGAAVVLLANWNSRRMLGLLGFFAAAISAAASKQITDLTTLTNLVDAGVLLLLPSSLLMWCALDVGGSKESPTKVGFVPIAITGCFGATLIIATPIAGNLVTSLVLAGNEGVFTTIIVLGFVAAIWSIAVFGRMK